MFSLPGGTKPGQGGMTNLGGVMEDKVADLERRIADLQEKQRRLHRGDRAAWCDLQAEIDKLDREARAEFSRQRECL